MLNNSLSVLLLGLALGIKHALDTDHIVAVSTLVSTHKNPLKALNIGAFWGLGHTTTLFLTGFLVLLFKVSIPDRVSLSLELIVGVMLIALGISTFKKNKTNLHVHEHDYKKSEHMHFHEHEDNKHHHSHKRSFFVGIVHGLAGSGALMLLVLSTIKSTSEGLLYILLFGFGSVGGMMVISVLMSLPYILAIKKFPGIASYVNRGSGIISIIVGILVIYEILYVEKLLG